MSKKVGFADLTLVLIVFFAASLIAVSNISVTKNYSQNDSEVKGVLIAKSENSGSGSSGSDSSGSSSSDVGSDGTSTSDSSGSDGSSGGSEDSGSSGSGGSNSSESEVKTETNSPSGVRIKTETKDSRQRTEAKFSEDEKIKTEVKDGRTRIDVYQGGVKVRYEISDGQVVIKAETEDGTEVTETELFKVRERIDRSEIKVASASGELLVQKGSVGAVSGLPVQIDLNTNELIVATPSGSKVVIVLPDAAVQNALAANAISRLSPNELIEKVEGSNVESISDVIRLLEKDGQMVYEISGLRENKLLGFIPVTNKVDVIVSAETGALVATKQSLLTNIVDLLSP